MWPPCLRGNLPPCACRGTEGTHGPVCVLAASLGASRMPVAAGRRDFLARNRDSLWFPLAAIGKRVLRWSFSASGFFWEKEVFSGGSFEGVFYGGQGGRTEGVGAGHRARHTERMEGAHSGLRDLFD